MARNLVEMARQCARGACSPHVVGAGIGARRIGESRTEPTLTLLVSGPVSREHLLYGVKGIKGMSKDLAFDVLDVGNVRALQKVT